MPEKAAEQPLPPSLAPPTDLASDVQMATATDYPAADECHEVAHATMIWQLGYGVETFCIKGAKGVSPAPEITDDAHLFAVAAAGPLCEELLLGIEDPSGCADDRTTCCERADHEPAGRAMVDQLFETQGSAILAAGEEIWRRSHLPFGNPEKLPACPEPHEVADILAKHWGGSPPEALKAQMTESGDQR